MVEIKHTPGPWKAYNNGLHWNNKEIDNWEIHWSDDGECVVDHVYEEADAYLISAAPDLLEALEEMVDLMEDIKEGNYKPDSFTCQPARTAIAKAKGEK